MATTTFKVLISDRMAQEGIDLLKEQYSNIEVDVKTEHTKEELIALIEPYHGIVIRSATKLTADVIAAAKNLKVIARAGTGYDNIDIDACNKRGIIVLITPLGNSNAVVELTMGLMLDWARKISRANASMQAGKWEKKKLKGTELRKKTVGIIGLGRIGAGVAKRCQAFEMNVLAFDKYLPKSRAEELGVELMDDVNDLVKQADYITLHLPLTETTRNLLDVKQFELMKDTAVIVNVARGPVVNEKGLYDALVNKKIGGACIDVYSKEPATKEEFPFIGLDNVITTPHLGASTAEAQVDVAKLAAEHLAEALNSQIFIDAVNVSNKLPEHLAEIYRPFMQLASDLGHFINNSHSAPFNEVEIEYRGDVITTFNPIKASILFALFENRLTDTITYMNLDEVLEHTGVKITINQSTSAKTLSNVIKIVVKSEDQSQSRIVGTVFSGNPKIMEINDHFMDISPSKFMLLLQSVDKPGVIGRVGTFLGNYGINIAGWQLGRESKGTNALSVITLDNAITQDVLTELQQLPDMIESKFIQL